MDFIFDNAYQSDAAEAEKEVRKKYPHLLGDKEKVELAFQDRGGMGRDKSYFTSHRVLVKDGKGITGKRKNYKTIPYSSIYAFATDTAGHFDGDVSVRIYSKGIPFVELEISSKVDIYSVQQFLNTKVCEFSIKGQQDEVDPTPPNMDKKESSAGKIMDWFGDNAKQLSAKEVEATFKAEMPVLLKNETVQIAFKSGRDYTVFTDMRCMIIDVQGFGKKVGFFSVLWKTIQAFSVCTAGSFLDRDMEMALYTNIPGIGRIEQDLRHGKADLFGLQKILCNHILGEDTSPMEGLVTNGGEVDEKGFWWFRDNQRPLDTVEMNTVYHSSPAILRGNETIEMAFRGRRDMTLFTNLRVIMIDPQRLTGTKVGYMSLPWTSITAHAVRTAGKYIDFDTEVCFWTELDFFAGTAGFGEDNPPEPPRPEQSYFEIDFNKDKVDMTALNYYLSHRLIMSRKQMEKGAPIPIQSMTQQFDQPGFGFEGFLQVVGGDQREIDPAAIDHELHSSTKILLDDEKVLMAFKAGRDTSLFTNYRVIMIDVQGLTGAQIEYTSLPYKAIRAWSCETAGTWDTDTELNLYTRNRWTLAKVDMDFRTGKADIAQINQFLSALIVGLPTDSKVEFGAKNVSSGKTEAHPIESSSFGLLDNCWEIDAKEIEKKLRSDPLLLLKEEKVLRAFQSGRDVDCYTNRRMIVIDTKGLSGKRVKYKSIPFREVYGYEFETNGPMDRDAEIYLHTEISQVVCDSFPRIVKDLVTKQSLLVKNIDIYEIGKFFDDHVLFAKEKYDEEPEVAL